MNRAHTILAEWDDHVAHRSTADPESARHGDEIHELRLALAVQKRECADPHRRPDVVSIRPVTDPVSVPLSHARDAALANGVEEPIVAQAERAFDAGQHGTDAEQRVEPRRKGDG